MYSLLYSNSNFYFNFQKDRGSTELDIGDWEQAEKYALIVDLYYIVVKHVIGSVIGI